MDRCDVAVGVGVDRTVSVADKTLKIGVASHGLWRVREDIATLLGATPIRVSKKAPADVDVMAGWGFKPTAAFARNLARERGIPYVALEDGFLRSVEPGAAPSLSYVVDEKGIYYDANQPSQLEDLLQDLGWLQPGEAERGLAAGRLLRDLKLSKYNTTRDASAHPPIGILVVDQTGGDASISGALASAGTFRSMLDAAIARAGREGVYVKLHPETIAGRKAGHLAEAAAETGVRIVDRDRSSWCVLESAREVYTVSSQLGFEAMLADVPVTCFGVPFYAGWGLTTDIVACPRRTGRPSLGALAAATLFHYAQYLDPWDRRRVTFEEAADALAFLRDRYHENASPSILVGMSKDKRAALGPFLAGPDGEPRVAHDTASAIEAGASGERLIVWGDRFPDIAARTAEKGLSLVRAEDGFIRSAGLGSVFVPSCSFVFDDLGIYYDPTGPSRFEVLAHELEADPALLRRAAGLRAALVSGRVTKYSAVGHHSPLPEDGRRRILVVGQVEDDASVIRGAPGAGGNLGLLERARARHPEALLVYRPHPDVARGYRRGTLKRRDILQHADVLSADVPIADLLDWCDGLETMTSLAGFEALIRGKPVAVHGQPFYGGWGLTEDLVPFPRRTRRLSLDELVAVALLLYPRYVDPVSGLPCKAEILVERLAQARLTRTGAWWQVTEAGRHLSARFRHKIVKPLAKAARRFR